MKSLNLTGTTAENFKIGTGNNSSELRVIQGKLYFKNFGDSFKQLLSNDAELILSPLEWSEKKNYSEGDLVYYNKILFKVISPHKSSSDFLTNTDNYRKIAHIDGNLTKINTNNYISNYYLLDVLSSDFIYIHGDNIGDFTLKLPDSNSISFGSKYVIQNNSNKIIKVINSSNELVVNININDSKELILIDNNVNDFWTSFSLLLSTVDFPISDEFKITFNNNDAKKFSGPSGIFIEDKPGKYSFFSLNDVKLCGDIYWDSNSEVSVTGEQTRLNLVSFGSNLASGTGAGVVSGTANSKFYYYLDNNQDLYFVNKTFKTQEVVFQFLYKKGIR